MDTELPIFPARWGLRLLVLLAAWTAGCVAFPIQLGRLPQNEAYTVTLKIPGTDQKPSFCTGKYDCADKVFTALVGESNWRALLKRYGAMRFLDELPERISIQGRTAFTLYPTQVSDDGFLLEGGGRFFVVRKRPNAETQILLSGDSFIDPQTFKWRVLESEPRRLELKIRYVVARIPGEQAYLHEGQTTMVIDFRRLEGQPDVYSIDYDANHEVWALVAGRKEQIGTLRFDDDEHEVKIVDLRGRRHLRTEY